MSKRQYAYFKELPPKTIFNYNGTKAIKHSTRTARFIDYVPTKSFYYGAHDLCMVAQYSRLGEGYFAANYHTNTSLPIPEYA